MAKNEKMRDVTPEKIPSQAALPGTELQEMAEQQGELIMRVINQRNVDQTSAVSDLAALYGILEGLAKKTVMAVFGMGKILSYVKDELPHGQFGQFIEAKCPFSIESAKRYIRVYECYKGTPKKQLEDLTLSQAYTEAGIKKLAAPPKQEGEKEPADDDLVDNGLPQLEDYSRLLETPPASGITLKRYRVQSLQEGKIHAIHPTLGIWPVADLYIPSNIERPDAYIAFQKATKDLCMAFEIYFAEIERLEDSGVLPRVEDHRFTAAVRKARGIEVEQPEKKKGKRGKK